MNFNPSEEEINFVNDALRRFNDDKVGPDNHVLLNIVEYAAESEAKKRGCHSVHVDTMSWQAPEFYKKHGYKIIILPTLYKHRTNLLHRMSVRVLQG